jgi:TatA/E family protein of Tat protein translocase
MPLPNGAEWIVILIIALLILGPGKLPDVAASVGKSIREFRKASSDVQEAVKVDTSPLPAATPNAPPTAQAVPPTPAPEFPAPPVAAAPAPAPVAAEPVAASQQAPSDATTESR